MPEAEPPVTLSPQQLVELYRDLGRQITGQADLDAALQAVTTAAVQRVPGAVWASVTRGTGGRFTTMAATDQVARDADNLQYRLTTGPCVQATADGPTVVGSSDLARDTTWVGWGQQVAARHGVRSVLSIRMVTDLEQLDASLNLYSDRTGAFDDPGAQATAELLATHGALAVTAVINRDRAEQMHGALDSNREIGIAMGVLMNQYRVTREQAFDLLRIASQNQNRKLRDIATDVADTGVMPAPPPRPAWRQRRPGRST